MLISDDLFSEVLVAPMRDGCNQLCIVSGYATAAMVFRHLQYAKENEHDIKLSLLVGMCSRDGISESNHRGFKSLVEDDFSDSFECSYVPNLPAVHSKVYVWLRDDDPACGFVGSANYTQTAFGKKQREAMAPCNADDAYNYYNSLLENSIYCDHNDVEQLIGIYRELREQRSEDSADVPRHLSGLQSVRVSLVTRQGNVPTRSGLNWGQRPEERRDPNQAYLSLRADVYKTDFFPEITVHFTVLTDDGKSMTCSRAQQGSKAIHTPARNALLGEYFKNRLGLSSGEMVTKEHLDAYGRDNVVFYKIDDETYYMDFSV